MLVESRRRGIGRAAMRARYRGAHSRWLKQPARGAFPDFGVERGRVGGLRKEVSDRFLKPGDDVGHARDRLLCQKAVHLVAESQFDSAVPEPADPGVDFAVVNFLKLDFEVRTIGHDLLWRGGRPLTALPPGTSKWHRLSMPSSKTFKADCHVCRLIVGVCDSCGASGPLHAPMKRSGLFCGRCCPVCSGAPLGPERG